MGIFVSATHLALPKVQCLFRLTKFDFYDTHFIKNTAAKALINDVIHKVMTLNILEPHSMSVEGVK